MLNLHWAMFAIYLMGFVFALGVLSARAGRYIDKGTSSKAKTYRALISAVGLLVGALCWPVGFVIVALAVTFALGYKFGEGIAQ